MSLTKEAILAATKPRVVEATIEEWGGTVTLRELSIDDIAGLAGKDTEDRSTSSRLIALSVVDGEGKPMFTVEEVGAMAASRGRKAMTALMAEIDKLNALSAKAQEQVATD